MLNKKNILSKTLITAACIASLSACSVIRGESSPQQFASDTAITAQVQKNIIQDSQLSISQLEVQTKKGVVLLSGFVKNRAQAEAAVAAARKVPGVKVVQTNFRTQP